MTKVEVKEKPKFREKYAVKIDLRDAIWGGVAIFVTAYLISYALIMAMSWIWFPDTAPKFLGGITSGIDTANAGMMGFLFAAAVATGLLIFFIAVLFEENFFSKHEKGVRDLLGLGLIWGMTVLSIDTILMSIMIPQGGGSVGLLPGLHEITSCFYYPLIVYIILMPVAIYYLRKDKAL